VNYTQLPEAVWTTLASHCAIAFSPEDVARMRQAARFDAKRPALPFQPDSHQKRHEATPSLRALADSLLMPLYHQLESGTGAGD
jgi:hypothetical protein